MVSEAAEAAGDVASGGPGVEIVEVTEEEVVVVDDDGEAADDESVSSASKA